MVRRKPFWKKKRLKIKVPLRKEKEKKKFHSDVLMLKTCHLGLYCKLGFGSQCDKDDAFE